MKLEIVPNPNVEFPTNDWYRSQLQIISEILETATYDQNARRNSHRPVLITRSEDSIFKDIVMNVSSNNGMNYNVFKP